LEKSSLRKKMMRTEKLKKQQLYLPLRTPENPEKNPEIPDFPETPKISPDIPDLLLKLRKAVKKLRI
jgi:delta-aminolevulinic acid dehydratase/porphobilinogen synthase